MDNVDILFNSLFLEVYGNGEWQEFSIKVGGVERQSRRLCLYSHFVKYRYEVESKMVLNFPIQTQRFHSFTSYNTEFNWEIGGGTNSNDLGKASYLWKTWANQDGSLPISYGMYWGEQIQWLLSQVESNPGSTRHVITTWGKECQDPPITDNNILSVPPCHPCLVFTKQGDKMNLNVISRSQDLVCGLPGDLIRYSLFLRLVANTAGLEMGTLSILFSNIHIYEDHLEKYHSQVFGKIGPPTKLLPSGKLFGYDAKKIPFKVIP